MGKRLDNESIIEVLNKAYGNLTAAARSLGVTRKALYNWVERDEELQQAVRDARESIIDIAENKLLQAINSGDMTAIIFTLKTLGKARGYIETKEVKVSDIEGMKNKETFLKQIDQKRNEGSNE